ncbi:MAG: hypothetical protein J7K00_05350 [Candidatus Diapherotrites archaeon]|nr:hypothetical protein [Candidatus Diapherotrites archaeon]
MFEVEFRGPISDRKYVELKRFLLDKGRFLGRKSRFLIDYSTFCEGIRERKTDVRARVTDGVPEMVIKVGGWGACDERKEILVRAEKGGFLNVVEAYAALGYKRGMSAFRFMENFEFDGVVFALVEIPGYGFYFELEVVVENEVEISAAKEKLGKMCGLLELEVWGDEGFFDFIDQLNKNVNKVFDFDVHGKDLVGFMESVGYKGE